MIKIKKSQGADTRSAKKMISKGELLVNSQRHIEDVKKAMTWFSIKLIEIAKHHDYTKIDNIDEFHEDFKRTQEFGIEDFKTMHWFKDIHLKERHHLTDRCPDDVNLFDVLERIADIVMAAMARTGKIYDDTLSPEILEKAYHNTIEMLKNNVEVEVGKGTQLCDIPTDQLYKIAKNHVDNLHGTFAKAMNDKTTPSIDREAYIALDSAQLAIDELERRSKE